MLSHRRSIENTLFPADRLQGISISLFVALLENITVFFTIADDFKTRLTVVLFKTLSQD